MYMTATQPFPVAPPPFPSPSLRVSCLCAAQSTEEDYNYDGLKDVLHLTLTFPVEQSSPVCSVKALLFFDVALSVRATLHNTCLVTGAFFLY